MAEHTINIPGQQAHPCAPGLTGNQVQAPKDFKDAAGEHDLANFTAALCETIMLEPKVERDEDLKKAITRQER